MSMMKATGGVIAGGEVTTNGWANIFSPTAPASNANDTLGGSGSTTVTITNSGSGIVDYDLDGAGFSQYVTGFTANAGDTLRWQVDSFFGQQTGTIEVFFDGVSVDTFTYDVTN